MLCVECPSLMAKTVLFSFLVNKGDRVAQLICEQILYPELEEVKVSCFISPFKKCRLVLCEKTGYVDPHFVFFFLFFLSTELLRYYETTTTLKSEDLLI